MVIVGWHGLEKRLEPMLGLFFALRVSLVVVDVRRRSYK
jgi:hypothetical protein